MALIRMPEGKCPSANAIAVHPGCPRPDPRPAWQTVREQAERLVGRGLTREEALRQADPGWGGE